MAGAWFSVHVSTHSRLKAAGPLKRLTPMIWPCFNTQPPKGGWLKFPCAVDVTVAMVSTHSRLKAAGPHTKMKYITIKVSTHSRLKAAGCINR